MRTNGGAINGLPVTSDSVPSGPYTPPGGSTGTPTTRTHVVQVGEAVDVDKAPVVGLFLHQDDGIEVSLFVLVADGRRRRLDAFEDFMCDGKGAKGLFKIGDSFVIGIISSRLMTGDLRIMELPLPVTGDPPMQGKSARFLWVAGVQFFHPDGHPVVQFVVGVVGHGVFDGLSQFVVGEPPGVAIGFQDSHLGNYRQPGVEIKFWFK